MPKNKQSKTPFWFFMLDWKTRQEAQGRLFPNGFRDVQTDPDVSRLWSSMSTSEKQRYVNQSKHSKNSANNKDKLTPTGESIREIKDREQRERDNKLNMEAHIRYTLATAKKNTALSSLNFIFLHVNWYYCTQGNGHQVDYCPAEFALAKFSVKDGVTDYYHEIIKTNIDSGYRLDATETSQKTHRLAWDLDFAQDNWRIIHEKFYNFLSSKKSDCGGFLPPIYTSRKILHVVPSLLRRMENAVGKRIIDTRLVYTVEALFECMVRAVSDFPESNAVRVIAETQLEKNEFEYTENLECDYHKSLSGSSPFCSLSIVRQWGLTFCSTCCQPLKIASIPGIHCPETPEMLRAARVLRLKHNSALFKGSKVPSAPSATGVRQEYSIWKSERRRNDRRSRGNHPEPMITDHSTLEDEEREYKPKPTVEQYEAVEQKEDKSDRKLAATASETLFGTASSDVPLFDSTNRASIGEDKTPSKKDQPRQTPVSIWKHRGHKNSDSD